MDAIVETNLRAFEESPAICDMEFEKLPELRDGLAVHLRRAQWMLVGVQRLARGEMFPMDEEHSNLSDEQADMQHFLLSLDATIGTIGAELERLSEALRDLDQSVGWGPLVRLSDEMFAEWIPALRELSTIPGERLSTHWLVKTALALLAKQPNPVKTIARLMKPGAGGYRAARAVKLTRQRRNTAAANKKKAGK